MAYLNQYQWDNACPGDNDYYLHCSFCGGEFEEREGEYLEKVELFEEVPKWACDECYKAHVYPEIYGEEAELAECELCEEKENVEVMIHYNEGQSVCEGCFEKITQ